MRPEQDPATLAPRERLEEVAAILAAGLLRLRARAALPADAGEHRGPEKPRETGDSCLELRAETVRWVHTG